VFAAVVAAGDALPTGASKRLGAADAKKQVETGPLVFSPDGKRLAVAEAGKAVILWNVATGKEERRWKPDSALVTALAFDAKGERLAVGDLDGKLRVLDVQSGEQKETHQKKKDAAVASIVFRADGSIVASWGGRFNQPAVLVWDSANAKEKDGRQVTDMATFALLSPDGKRFAWVGPPRAVSNGSIHVLDLAPGGKTTEIAEHSPFITTLLWSPNGKHLAADGGDQGEVCVYEVGSDTTRKFTMEGYDLHKLGAFGNGGKTFIHRATNDSIDVYPDFPDTRTRKTIKHPGGCRGLALSPDGKILASAAPDGSILLFPLDANK
jgi:WD40 repeat protein